MTYLLLCHSIVIFGWNTTTVSLIMLYLIHNMLGFCNRQPRALSNQIWLKNIAHHHFSGIDKPHIPLLYTTYQPQPLYHGCHYGQGNSSVTSPRPCCDSSQSKMMPIKIYVTAFSRRILDIVSRQKRLFVIPNNNMYVHPVHSKKSDSAAIY